MQRLAQRRTARATVPAPARLLALVLSVLLALVTVPALTGTATAGPSTRCAVLDRDLAALSYVDRTTGAETVGPPITMTGHIDAAAYGIGGAPLYVTTPDRLATIDEGSGAVSVRASVIGTATAPSGSVAFDHVRGITVHPWTGQLFAVQNVAGADDALAVLDPSTGTIVPSAFGTGTGFVRVATSGLQSELRDLAASPTDGALYGLHRGPADHRLLRIDRSTGAASVVGVIATASGVVEALDGLSFATDGTLYAVTANSGSTPRTVFSIVPTSGAATAIATLPGAGVNDPRALACLSADANRMLGTVYRDEDADGTLGPGDTGLSGVPVWLYRDLGNDGAVGPSDPRVQTTTTSAGGAYAFGVAGPGAYVALVPIYAYPTGTRPTTTTQRAVVFVGPGQVAAGNDIGFVRPFIEGLVFNDLDGNGVRGPAEPALAGVDIAWAAVAPATGAGAVVSDSNGQYRIPNRDAGDHVLTASTVGLGSPPVTTTNPVTVRVSTGRVIAPAVGVRAPATIRAVVFDDVDGDGAQQAGERGLQGYRVEVRRAGDPTVLATLLTDVNGSAALPGQRPATYELQVVAADLLVAQTVTSTVPTSLTVGPNDTQTGTIGLTTGAPGARSITLAVFDDGNANGTRQPGEAGLPELTVNVRDGGGATVAIRTTDAAGEVLIDGLPAGTYTLRSQVPTAKVASTPNPATVTIDATTSAMAAIGFEAESYGATLTPSTSSASADAGAIAVHAVTLTNAGNVPDRYDLSVAGSGWPVRVVGDAAPVGIYDPATDLPVSRTATVPRGDSVPLLVVVDVGAGARRSDTQTQRLVATSIGDPARSVMADQTTIATASVLDVTMRHNATGLVVPDTVVLFTAEVTARTDIDTSAARGVVVAFDGDPGHGTYDPNGVTINGVAAPPGSVTATATGIEVALPNDIALGATRTVTAAYRIATPLPDGTVISQSASARATNRDPSVPSAAVTSVTVDSAPAPSAAFSAAPVAGQVAPGTPITYTLRITNAPTGTERWNGIGVEVDLPTGVSYVSGSARRDGVSVGGGAAFPLAVGASLVSGLSLAPNQVTVVTFDLVVADPILDGQTLSVLAQVDGANTGPLLRDTTHTVATSVGVTVGPDSSTTAGRSTTAVHSVRITNTGNVTSTFDLDAAADLGWTVRIHEDDGDGIIQPAEAQISSVTLAGGAFVRVNVAVEVPAGAAARDVATTTVSATSTGGVAAAAFLTTSVAAPVLRVRTAVAPSSSSVNPGQRLSYTVSITNTGTEVATGVVVADPSPGNTTYVRNSARVDGAPIADVGAGDRNPFGPGYTVGTIGVGVTRTIAFDVTVDAATADGATVVNLAAAAGPATGSASDATTQVVDSTPVLSLLTTATPPGGSAVSARQVITYRIRVNNTGSRTATGVTLTAEPPAGTIYIPGTTTLDGAAVPDRGGESELSTANGGLALGSLNVGAAARIVQFQAEVAAGLAAGTQLRAVSRALAAEGVSGTSAPVVHTVEGRAAVSLTSAPPVDVAPPEAAAFPHVVTNLGVSDDSFSLVATSSEGWPVSIFLDENADGVWDRLNETTSVSGTTLLPPSARFHLIVVVEAPSTSAPGTRDLTQLVVSSVAEPTVTATATDATTAVAPALTVTKSATPSGSSANVGQEIAYVVRIRNRGGAAAQNVLVVDDLPAGTRYVPNSAAVDGVRLADQAAGDTNPLSTANGGHTIARIAPGALVSVSLRAIVTAPPGATVTNTATVTPAGGTEETATKQHLIGTGPALDLTSTPTPPETTALRPGDQITYVMRVRNAGSAAATDVLVTSDTPGFTTYVPGSATRDGVAIPDGADPTDPNPFSTFYLGVPVGDLALGAPAVELRYRVVVRDTVRSDSEIVQDARARSAEDARAITPEVRHDVEVRAGVDLGAARGATGRAGTVVTLPHTVTNTGGAIDQFDLVVADDRGWLTTVHADRDGDGQVDADEPEITRTSDLGAGESQRLLIAVTVPTGTPAETTDRVRLTAVSGVDPVVNVRVEDTVRVVAGALTATAAASPLSVTPGGASTYTLTVTNAGGDAASDVVVFDAVPQDTTYVAGSTKVDGVSQPDGPGGSSPLVAGLRLGDLPVGATRTIAFDVVVSSAPSSTAVVNSVEATATDAATARAGTVQPIDVTYSLDLQAPQSASVAPGQRASLLHRVANRGDVADRVALRATTSSGYPAQIHLDDGDGVRGPGDTLAPAFVTLAPATSRAFFVDVDVPADAPQGERVEVLVQATSQGGTGTAVSLTDVLQVIGASLLVDTSVNPAPDVAAGGTLAYSTTVRNTGTAPAKQVTVKDVLPLGTVYLVGSTKIDGAPVPDVEGRSALDPEAGGLGIGDLEPGAAVTLEVTVIVPAQTPAGAVLSAFATAAALDTAPARSTTATVTVVERATLTLTKELLSAATQRSGSTVTWQLVVANAGTGPAGQVVILDQLPEGLAYVEGSTILDGVNVVDGLTTAGLDLGALEPGASRTLVFDTRVDGGTTGLEITNVAEVLNANTSIVTVSNQVPILVGANDLPATGLGVWRTLVPAGALLALGAALLYVARPSRWPDVVEPGR